MQGCLKADACKAQPSRAAVKMHCARNPPSMERARRPLTAAAPPVLSNMKAAKP